MSCAALLFLAFPPPFASTATLLLKQSSPSERALQNDAELVKTRTVARRAIQHASLDVTPDEFRSRLTVTALSDEILQLTVRAPTKREAMGQARGLVAAFLSFRTEELERQAGVVADTLQGRLNEFTEELALVNEQIAALSAPVRPEGEAAVRTLGDLLGRRATLGDRQKEIRQQIDAAFLQPRTVARQSRVLDPPSPAPRSPLKALLPNLAAGAIGGLGLGVGWVVIGALTSQRVWRRQEVLVTLGTPVAVAAIGAYSPSTYRVQRRRFRKGVLDGNNDRRVGPLIRQLRRTLPAPGSGNQSALLVVSEQSDGVTSIALSSMAAEIAEGRHNVLLADLSGSSAIARLFGVHGKGISLVHTGANGGKVWLTAPRVSTDETSPPLSPDDFPDIAVVLAMGTPDDSDALSHFTAWGRSVVAVVTAGRSTQTQLRAMVGILAAAGLQLAHVILVGADPDEQALTLLKPHGDTRRQATGAS